MQTPYGSKSVGVVQPGKTSSQAFTTRLAQIEPAMVSVTAGAVRDGVPVTSVIETPYALQACG